MKEEIQEKHKEHGKLYTDQLYKTKILTPLAVAIIDTPEFQRKRNERDEKKGEFSPCKLFVFIRLQCASNNKYYVN